VTRVDLRTHRSAGQFLRFLLVGGFNTLFGYGLFALLNWLLRRMPAGYLLATLFSNLIAITVAFLGYKWFVFRTQGHYLREWLRCVGVYGTSMAIGLAGMAVLVPLLRRHMARPAASSYVAAALMMTVTVGFSFVGHKRISFRQALAVPDNEERAD
jgi:putative flippase GtrA